jgi:hypothetical protein
MLERLRQKIGCSIVVDYRSNTGKIFFAKGILVDILDESKIIVVEGKDGTIWYINSSAIDSLKINGEEGEAG